MIFFSKKSGLDIIYVQSSERAIFYTEVVSSAKLEIFVARFQAPRFFKKNTHLFPVHSCHSHSHSTVMPISLKKSKTNSGAAVASSAAAETPKKSFLPKGSKSTAGKVGQSGAADGSTPGTKRKYGASNNKNAVLVKWGVSLINDDEYSRSKLLRDLSYKSCRRESCLRRVGLSDQTGLI